MFSYTSFMCRRNSIFSKIKFALRGALEKEVVIKMKKFMLFLVMALTLSLVACGSGSGSNSITRSGGSAIVTSTKEFSFRPNTSGIWTIETTDIEDGADPYLWLFGPNGINEENDDGGYGRNARIRVYLDSGTTYTIRAGHYDNNERGSYVLRVSKGGSDIEQDTSAPVEVEQALPTTRD